MHVDIPGQPERVFQSSDIITENVLSALNGFILQKKTYMLICSQKACLLSIFAGEASFSATATADSPENLPGSPWHQPIFPQNEEYKFCPLDSKLSWPAWASLGCNGNVKIWVTRARPVSLLDGTCAFRVVLVVLACRTEHTSFLLS